MLVRYRITGYLKLVYPIYSCHFGTSIARKWFGSRHELPLKDGREIVRRIAGMVQQTWRMITVERESSYVWRKLWNMWSEVSLLRLCIGCLIEVKKAGVQCPGFSWSLGLKLSEGRHAFSEHFMDIQSTNSIRQRQVRLRLESTFRHPFSGHLYAFRMLILANAQAYWKSLGGGEEYRIRKRRFYAQDPEMWVRYYRVSASYMYWSSTARVQKYLRLKAGK